jgi:hypothetical protein
MKKNINLYIDDLLDCPDRFIISRTVEQAKNYFENFQIEILSLDHDLGVHEKGIYYNLSKKFKNNFREFC